MHLATSLKSSLRVAYCYFAFAMAYIGVCASEPKAIISNSGPTLANGQDVFSKWDPLIVGALRRRRQERLAASYDLPQSDIDFLVDEHNRYRRIVPATDMRLISWDSNLAASAQAYANQCVFAHSRNRVNAGENLYASPLPSLKGAVKMWFEEVYNNACGCTNYYKYCCGHYTQVAWASTTRVGCGFASCNSILYAPGHRHILVCQYSPAGNIVYSSNGQSVGKGGFTYRKDGESACAGCPGGNACDNGLCRS